MVSIESAIREAYLMPAIYARRNVEVILGSDSAYCDDGKIFLPCPTEETLQLSKCYVAHESAHQAHCDFDVLPKDLDTESLRGWLWNLGQDAVDERKHLREFPGDLVVFEEATKLISGNYRPADPDDLDAVVSNFMMQYIRGPLGGYKSNQKEFEDARTSFIEQFGFGPLAELTEHCNKVLSCESTQDVLDLADSFLRWFEEQPEEPEPPEGGVGSQGVGADANGQQQAGSGNGGTDANGQQQAESGNGGTDANGQQQAESGNSGTDANGQQQAESGNSGTDANGRQQAGSGNSGSDASSQQAGGNGAGAGAGKKPEATDEQKRNAFNKALKKLSEVESGQLPSVDVQDQIAAKLSKDNDNQVYRQEVGDEELNPTLTKPEKGNGQKYLQQVAGVSGSLGSKMRRLLEDETRSRTVMKNTGRLSQRHLFGPAVGECNIFKQVRKGRQISKAITVLLDSSGSMKDDQMELARKSVLAVTEALSGLPGIDIQAYTFGGDIRQLKSWRAMRGEYSSNVAGVESGGGTPMISALWAAINSRHDCPARDPNHLFLVMTDGAPRNFVGTQKLLEQIRRSNIDVIGVGMGAGVSAKVMHDLFGYKHTAMVPNFNTLPAAMLGVTQKAIL